MIIISIADNWRFRELTKILMIEILNQLFPNSCPPGTFQNSPTSMNFEGHRVGKTTLICLGLETFTHMFFSVLTFQKLNVPVRIYGHCDLFIPRKMHFWIYIFEFRCYLTLMKI